MAFLRKPSFLLCNILWAPIAKLEDNVKQKKKKWKTLLGDCILLCIIYMYVSGGRFNLCQLSFAKSVHNNVEIKINIAQVDFFLASGKI